MTNEQSLIILSVIFCVLLVSVTMLLDRLRAKLEAERSARGATERELDRYKSAFFSENTSKVNAEVLSRQREFGALWVEVGMYASLDPAKKRRYRRMRAEKSTKKPPRYKEFWK